MSNLVEIDLDQNVVIPIPDGFTKNKLAEMVAKYKGYQETILQVESKKFSGTYEQLLELEKDYEQGKTFFIIEEIPTETTDFNYNYQTIKEINNPVSMLEYGIAHFIKPGGDLVREAISNALLAQKKQELLHAEEQVQEVLSVLDNIKAT